MTYSVFREGKRRRRKRKVCSHRAAVQRGLSSMRARAAGGPRAHVSPSFPGSAPPGLPGHGRASLFPAPRGHTAPIRGSQPATAHPDICGQPHRVGVEQRLTKAQGAGGQSSDRPTYAELALSPSFAPGCSEPVSHPCSVLPTSMVSCPQAHAWSSCLQESHASRSRK